jgi:hypothetical protein
VYTWDNPAPVIVIRSAPEVSCHVGVIFVWDNGAGLANTSCEIRLGNGQILDATLNEQSFISQRVNSDRHKVQLQAWFDPKSALTESRAELKKILEEILVVERQEAAELKKVQDQRRALENLFYAQRALGKGFLLGAWGLVRTLDEFSDLVDPYTLYTNAARSAWNAQSTRDKTWIDSFRENFSAEHHRELVEALGFDPSSITREQLAQAYEMACFIFEDDDSKRTLAKFAMDYAQAQNHEEIIEFSGGVAFEIVLAALLIALTGGIGLAARGSAASAKLLPLLKRLGTIIHTLGRNLRNARLHTKGRAEGQGTKAQTVEIPRPGEVKPSAISGKDIGILRDAAKGKGNFGLGTATRAEADKLGKAWVGPDSKIASDGSTLVSRDGMRQYRPPKHKPRLDISQANFERKFPGQETGRWQSNGHLDITD